MTRAERLAHMRAIVDDLRARADAAMKDLGSDGSPGAYFTGYASIALQELDAVLRAEEAAAIEHVEKGLAFVRAREALARARSERESITPRPRLAVVAGGAR